MKQIVKPKTAHMLMLNAGEMVHDHRPSVITAQDYVQARIAKGEISVLETDLPDEASDAKFQEIWETTKVDGKADDKKAITAFMKTLEKPKDK